METAEQNDAMETYTDKQLTGMKKMAIKAARAQEKVRVSLGRYWTG